MNQLSEGLFRSPRGGGYTPARKLSKRDLGGAIFGCKNSTMGECLTKQLFGLPSAYFHFVRNIEPGMTLFLFNYSDRKLHGIYEAASHGEMNVHPHAWTNDGKEKTGFPAQVRIRIRMQCKSITENQFKKVIIDNYYGPRHFCFELDHAQTEGLLALFLSSDLSAHAMTPHPAFNDANLCTTLEATRRNLGTNFERVGSKTVEPTRVNECPLPNYTDKHIEYGSNDTMPATNIATLEKEPFWANPIEGNGVSQSEVIHHEESISRTLLEQGFRCENLESGKASRHVEKPSADPSCSTSLSTSCIDYHIPYLPIAINEGNMFVDKSFVSVEKENKTPSDMPNGNAELVHVVKELKERSAALEKKQFESEAEIQRLQNDVKESGLQINLLKDCVNDLESKLLRSVGSENVIYLIGGFNGKSWLSALDSFSPSMDILIPLKSMWSSRSYASAAVLNGNLYVFGGGDGSSWFNTVECYNPRNDNWTLCPPLIRSKGSLAGATLNGKIFALGGGNGSDCFSDVEMFDPAHGRWIYNQSMLQKRFAPAAAELHGVLYSTGGYDGKDYLQTAERLDPRVGYWTNVPNMKARRGCHSMAVFKDTLYVMGGFDGQRMTSSVEIFDPRNDSWIEGEPLNLARGYASAAVLGDSLFIIGGVDGDNNIVETVECYDEGTTAWATGTNKAVGKRCFFSAIVP